MAASKPILSKQAFWDVDMENIDYEKNARFVVEKVIARGKLEDFNAIRKFYGDKRIKEEITQARWLSDIDINFCCKLFDLQPQQFRCYTIKQSNPQLWVY